MIRHELRKTEGINNANFGWGDNYVSNLVEEKFKSEAITHRIENATKERPLGKLPEISRDIKAKILRNINKDIGEKNKRSEKKRGE